MPNDVIPSDFRASRHFGQGCSKSSTCTIVKPAISGPPRSGKAHSYIAAGVLRARAEAPVAGDRERAGQLDAGCEEQEAGRRVEAQSRVERRGDELARAPRDDGMCRPAREACELRAPPAPPPGRGPPRAPGRPAPP